MKKPGALLVVVLALLAAESAMAADLPLPAAVATAVPSLPTVAVPLPTVLAPIVSSTPALPQLPQLSNLPAVPDVPGVTSAPKVPSVTSPPQPPATRAPSPSRGGGTTAGQAPSGRPASGTSGSAGSPAPASTSGTSGTHTGTGRTRTAIAHAHRERRLRTTVRRLQHCFGGLSGLERRVLVLRAGIGVGPPRSRARVARRLDLSARRVARIERHGLRTLRGLAGAGRCGTGNASGGQAVAGALVGGSSAGTGSQGEFTSASHERSAVRAERKSSGTSAPAAESDGLIEWLPQATVGGVDITLPLLFALALAGGLFATRAVRRDLASRPPG